MAILTNSTLVQIADAMEERNRYLSMISEVVGSGRQYRIGDWTPVKAMIQAGTAQTKFTLGTQFLSTYTATNGQTYEMPWDVVHYGDVTLADGTTKKGMFLQSHYATLESVPFDAKEPSNPDSNIKQYGYNRWSQSAIRQWLNSEALAGAWWSAQSEYDVAPSQLSSCNGFLHGLDSVFAGAITAVKQNTATNTITDGGVTDVTCDKIFLPSVEQMYGVPQLAGAEGEFFHYWRDATELSAPSNNANDGRIIYALENHNSAQYCRLRSAYRGYSYDAWYVSTAGYLNSYHANSAYRCAPACVIT